MVISLLRISAHILAGHKNKLSIDAQTLLFASSNALVQFSPMLIIPILIPLMTHHLGAQKDQLPLLFLSGGIAGYLSTKLTGVLTSRFSALKLATVSTLLFVVSLLIPAMGLHSALLLYFWGLRIVGWFHHLRLRSSIQLINNAPVFLRYRLR